MQPVSTELLQPASQSARRPDAFSELGSQDFLRLLITQLTTQDPLEPTGNKELLEQLSSIRNIEMSTTLTDSLRTLTGDQRFGSAASLIGQYVVAAPNEDGSATEGVVTGVRFQTDGRPVLELANGSTLPLDEIAEIRPPSLAAERLVGFNVAGIDRRQQPPVPVEGIVTGASADDRGEAVLELDNGATLRLRDLAVAGTPANAS